MIKRFTFLFMLMSLAAFTDVKGQSKASSPGLVPISNGLPVAKSGVSVNTDNSANDHPHGGTFQLIQKKGTAKEGITTETLKMIEEKRSEDKEQILVLSESLKVRIPSKRQIASPSFRPYTELYSFE